MRQEQREAYELRMWGSAILIFIGVLVPMIVLYTPWIPEGQSLQGWFQRSGSVLVVFSILSKLVILPLYDGKSSKSLGYIRTLDVLSLLTFTLAAIGTVIWGYGDLLF